MSRIFEDGSSGLTDGLPRAIHATHANTPLPDPTDALGGEIVARAIKVLYCHHSPNGYRNDVGQQATFLWGRSGMQIQPAVLKTIGAIYDTVLTAENWQGVLDGMGSIADLPAVNLFVSDPTYPEIQVAKSSSRLSPAVVKEYQDRFEEIDRRGIARLMSYPPCTLVRDTELLRGPVEPQLAAWLAANLGVSRRLVASLNKDRGWIDGITFNIGTARAGRLTRSERRSLEILLPHFAKAVELSRPFQVLQARFRAVIGVLDRFHIAVAILSASGELIVLNKEARRIFESRDGLSKGADGRPRADADPPAAARLSGAIDLAIRVAEGQTDVAEQIVTIPRRSLEDPYIVEVSPLRSGSSELDRAFRGALLLIIDPARHEIVSTRGMSRLYDLTPAESQVLGLVVEGHSTQEIADTRNTTLETVRGHIKGVFSKTRTKTRAALVRLALTVNLPIDPSD